MQPVWVLSVDLQTKTATFQSGLSDAARSARGAFTDIKGGAGEMGKHVSGNMMEARHGVMLLGEEFGVHLPRALTTFIASIGPVGAAMEAAFPFLAIAVGATLLLEHLAKLHEDGEKLTQDQMKFGIAAQNAFNALDTKLLEAGLRSDELNNDHLGALHKQLELIDHQSMEELVKSFELLAKSADVVFGELKSSWYQFGIGSAGAKHALEDFQTHYDALLAQERTGEASGLLTGTLAQARKILDLQQMAQKTVVSKIGSQDAGEEYLAISTAHTRLRETGVGWTVKEVAAQEQLVDALSAQVGIEQKVAALKDAQGKNAGKASGNAEAARVAAGQKEAADSQLRIAEVGIAADRAAASSQLTIKRASIAERLASDIAFADREQAVRLAANQAERAALDKSGKDYTNQLKALHDKALELTATHAAAVRELKSKAATESDAKDIRDVEQTEREKIDATEKGSAERLAAIDAAIKIEEKAHLQDSAFYRDLLKQRLQTDREMTTEEEKQRAEAGKQESEHLYALGELGVQAMRQAYALEDSAGHVNDAKRMTQELAVANEENRIKAAALAGAISALDVHGKDYANKLKQIQDKEKQQIQQHENEITAIKTRATLERNSRITAAEDRFRDALAQGLTQTIMGHQSFAKMMSSLGDQVVSGMLQNAIKSMLTADMSKEKDAAHAARKAYNIGVEYGGPAGVVLGPVFGAAAFAAVMAFEKGGIVPGIGTGDTVPAMLTPGEPVLPKNMADRLNRAMSDNGPENHIHVHGANFSPVVHAVDADGVDRMLTKHGDRFQRHLETTLRKLNK